ncbi:MAG: bactofilin family protein [Phycisphaerales bacterium]
MADDMNVTVIAADTQIKGEMTFERSCKLMGRFEGTITAKGQLHVAEGATCKAQVEAATVIVDGLVEGNITAKEQIQLNAKARINGDITAGKLVMAEGACVNGHVSVGGEPTRAEMSRPAVAPAVAVTPPAPAAPPVSPANASMRAVGARRIG